MIGTILHLQRWSPQHEQVVISVPAASTGVFASLLLLGGGSQASSSSLLRETDTELALGGF